MKTPFNIRWWNNQAESEYLGLKLKETRILGVNVLEVSLSEKSDPTLDHYKKVYMDPKLGWV